MERSDKIFNGLVNPIVDKLITGRTGGISAKSANEPSINIPSISSGYQFGFKPVDYSIQQPTQLQPEGFADGTTGGLGIKSQFAPQATGLPSPAETSLQPKNLAIEPTQTEQTNQETGLDLLGKRDPKLADTVARNVFGMSGKDFQKLSGALALVDFANGKSTATDLTNHMEGLRKIQSEGVLRSANAAIAGNEKEAIALYHDQGADTDSVASMKKIRIENPIAGAHKNMKDSYDGVLVTLKDGSKLTLDPRRLAADVIGVAKSMEHDEKVDNSIRVQTSAKYSSDTVRDQTAETREGRLQLQRDALDRQLQGMVATDLENETKRRLKLFMDDSSIDQKLKKPDQVDRQYSEIMSSLRPVAEVASLNISGGLNKNASFNNVFEAMRNPEFVDNGQGQPVIKQVNGRDMMLTSNGVWLPRNGSPMRTDPAASSGPAPDASQVSAPPPAPAPAPPPARSSAPIRSIDGGRTYTLDIPQEIRDPSVPYYREIRNPIAELGRTTFRSRQEAEQAYLNATR